MMQLARTFLRELRLSVEGARSYSCSWRTCGTVCSRRQDSLCAVFARRQYSVASSSKEKDDERGKPAEEGPQQQQRPGAGAGAGGYPLSHPCRVMSGMCVVRLPSLSRERGPLEQRMEEMKDQLRVERSRLSDHELEELEYLKKKKEREKRAMEEEMAIAKARSDTTGEQFIEEFEDLQEAQLIDLQQFSPAPREIETSLQSPSRKLDRVLYLLVKKPRAKHAWQMPQGELAEGETLLQAAERELAVKCGSDLKVQFLSNAPLAYYSYTPSTSGTTTLDSKVFFLKACYLSGEVELCGDLLREHAWVTKEEMEDFVSPGYYKSVAPVLLE